MLCIFNPVRGVGVFLNTLCFHNFCTKEKYFAWLFVLVNHILWRRKNFLFFSGKGQANILYTYLSLQLKKVSSNLTKIIFRRQPLRGEGWTSHGQKWAGCCTENKEKVLHQRRLQTNQIVSFFKNNCWWTLWLLTFKKDFKIFYFLTWKYQNISLYQKISLIFTKLGFMCSESSYRSCVW